MRVVSFHTPDGVYPKFAAILRTSCERFGIPCEIDVLPSKGEWNANLGLKPAFLHRRLLAAKGPIVWLDVDCEIIQRPVLLEEGGADVMIYEYNADTAAADPQARRGAITVASGVVRLEYNSRVLRFLYQWGEACRKEPRRRDDEHLGALLERKAVPGLTTKWLPMAYNRMDRQWPWVEPVINHVWRDGLLYFQGDEEPRAWVKG